MSFTYPSNSSYTSEGVVLSPPTDFSDNMSVYMHEDFDMEAWRDDCKNKRKKDQPTQPTQHINNTSNNGLKATNELQNFLKDCKLGVYKPAVNSTLDYSSIVESTIPSPAKSEESSGIEVEALFPVSSGASSRALSKPPPRIFDSKASSKAPSRIDESKASSKHSPKHSSQALSSTVLKAQIQSFSRPPNPNFGGPTFDRLTQADQIQASVSTEMLPASGEGPNPAQNLLFLLKQYESEITRRKDVESRAATLGLSLGNLNKTPRAQSDEELQQFKALKAEIIRQFNGLKAQHDEVVQQNNTLKAQHDEVVQQNNTLEAQHDEAVQQRNTLEARHGERLQQYGALIDQYNRIIAGDRAQYTDVGAVDRAQLTEATAKNETLQNEVNEYKTLLAEARNLANKYFNKNMELDARVSELDNRMEIDKAEKITSDTQTDPGAPGTALANMREERDKWREERHLIAKVLMQEWGESKVGVRTRADGTVGIGYNYEFFDKDGNSRQEQKE